jgi:putative ABC transport system permease protein
MESQYPDTNAGFGVRLVALHEQVTKEVRTLLLVLMGAVCFVLLIACANIANLTLARGAVRHKEIAIRSALGARRLRVVRQLLTESLLLALAGGTVGLLLSVWGLKALVAFGPDKIPRRGEISIDAVVLAFTLGVTILTGLIFGLVPALEASRPDLNESLKEGGKAAGAGAKQTRLRSALVVSEIALSLVLLVCAGLLIRSFVRLLDVNPGFDTENVMTLSLLLPQTKYGQPQQRAAFYQQLEGRIKALPDVTAVGAVTRLPMLAGDVTTARANITSLFIVEGREASAREAPEIDFRRASSYYFKALGVPLLQGRFLTDQDAANNPRVALINEAAARRFFPGEDPVGKRVRFGLSAQQDPWWTVVGVVGNVRHFSLNLEPRPEVYLHYLTSPLTSPIVVIRTASDPREMIGAVRAQVRGIDADLPIANVNTMAQLVSRSVAERRFSMLLLGIFAGVALLLAAVGIYGVISYSVAERTREIGIRIALGATSADVLRLVVGRAMILTSIGIALGLVGAISVTRVMKSLLFGVSTLDLGTFAIVSLVLAIVALAASYIPARKATRVDPMIALRYE